MVLQVRQVHILGNTGVEIHPVQVAEVGVLGVCTAKVGFRPIDAFELDSVQVGLA